MPTKLQRKSVEEAPFLKEMRNTAYNMWRMGWDERNGGNISYLLQKEEVSPYLDEEQIIRSIPIQTPAKELWRDPDN